MPDEIGPLSEHEERLARTLLRRHQEAYAEATVLANAYGIDAARALTLIVGSYIQSAITIVCALPDKAQRVHALDTIEENLRIQSKLLAEQLVPR